MAEQKDDKFDYAAFVAKHGGSVSNYPERSVLFRQDDPVDATYYIISGIVTITVHSEFGKEALIAVLGAGDFFGERGIDQDLRRISTATTAADCQLARLDRAVVNRAMAEDPDFSQRFMKSILQRNKHLQETLTNLLFHTSEQRLARILLTMANIRMGARSGVISVPVNQVKLAAMVGTTRSRINQFMNKFRRLRYVDYNGTIRVHRCLRKILRDSASSE